MAAWTPPSEADVARYFHRLNNWGRWGADDQKGTLNLITPAKRAAAVALARSGRVVSLARDIAPQPALDYHLLHPLRRGPSRAAIDYVGMIYHGQTVTHLDALCHVEYEGKLYNGRSFDDGVDHGGATWGALDPWFEGLVTRGVLLGCRGRPPRGLRCAGPARDTAGSGRGHGSGGGQRGAGRRRRHPERTRGLRGEQGARARGLGPGHPGRSRATRTPHRVYRVAPTARRRQRSPGT
jgi:hypothetical protein